MNDEQDSSSRSHLTPVPDLQPVPESRTTVAKWVLTLSEPLISTSRRAAYDREMASLISKSPNWAAVWFAGFISDVTKTLPQADPWRRLSAFIDLNEISIDSQRSSEQGRLLFHNRAGVKPPSATGAIRPDGEPFGTYRDALDLVMSELGPPETDEKLTAVAFDLEPLSSAIIGFASSNVEALAATLEKVYHHMWLAEFYGKTDTIAGQAFLDVVGEALRRVIHRRRAYTGNDDPFPSVAGYAWVARADRVINGGRNVAAELGLARDAMIDPAAYEQFRSDFT